MVGGSSGAKAMLAVLSSRASMKNASAAAPVFVTVTGMVTGTPAVSFEAALFGKPSALALVPFSLMLPLNGWEISLPTTGSAKSTISVQVPATGLRVKAVAEGVLTPFRLFCPKPTAAPSGLTRYMPIGSPMSFFSVTLAVMLVCPGGTLNS